MKLNTKPKLLIAALSATLFAVPVMAEVEVYGQAHLSYDSVDNGVDTTTQAASNSSRFGIKGSKEIGALTAIYQFESGVDLTGRGTNDGNGDGTANNLFTTARDSYVGLSGNFGTIMGGRLGVVNQWLYDANLFADQVGDLGNTWGVDVGKGRENGLIAYASPNMSGFDFLAAYKSDEGTKDTDVVVAKANYAIGGLKLGLGYTNIGNGITKPDTKATAVTASYTMDNLTFVGGYQTTDNVSGINGNDKNSYTFGASAGLGEGLSVKAQVTNVSADAVNADATAYALGLDYSLDKSTTLYVAYAATDNDASANYTANNWGHGGPFGKPADGKDPSAISVGVVHKFGVKL